LKILDRILSTTKVEDFYMHNSKHPQEQMFLQCAYDAIEYFSKYP